MTTITDRIARWLAFCGISQAQLARSVGMTPQQLQKLMAGKVRRSKHLQGLAKAMETTPGWLTDGMGDAPVWWSTPAIRKASSVDEKLDQLIAEVRALRRLIERRS